MNKKVMAIAMAAVMIMSAAVIAIGFDQGSDGAAGTESDPKIIMGSKNAQGTITPCTLYKDQTAGVDASIEFNASAFTSKKSVSFTVNGTPAGVDASTHLLKTGTVADNNNINNSCVDVTISKRNTGIEGGYSVNFKGTSSSDENIITITIVLTVKDYISYTNAEDNIPLPEQTYYFVAYVKVVDNTGSITLSGTGVGADGTSLTFKFETDADIKVTINNGTKDISGYKFYATGLPSGISMTVDGNIGGTVSNTYKTVSKSGTYCIYAVSVTGAVIKLENKNWSIGGEPVSGSFETTVTSPHLTGATAVADGNYIVMTDGEKFNTDISSTNTITNQKLTYNGIEYTSDSESNKFTIGTGVDITCNGTGTFKVIVEADVTTDKNDGTNTPAKTVHVIKSFTVYVVGKIVDADLDPSVTSN